MVRNILILVVLGVLLFVGYKAWQTHQQTVKNDNGDFTCQGCMNPDEKARFDKENRGEGADGNSERKTDSARVAGEKAVDGTGNTAVVTTPGAAPAAAGTSSMVAPDNNYSLGAGATTNAAPAYVPTTGTGLAGSVPATDSQAANAQNGQRFSGSGAYLVYRQGNITYRLDTTTGHSCIIYATMEEWRKPIVMSNGCGRVS